MPETDDFIQLACISLSGLRKEMRINASGGCDILFIVSFNRRVISLIQNSANNFMDLRT